MNFSLGHKITITLTRRLRLHSAKQTSRHLLFRVQVDAKSSLSKCRKSNSSDQRARFVTPFEKSAAHHAHEKIYRVDRRTYVGLALSKIHDAYKAVSSASSIRVEQVLLLSDGDYKRSTMLHVDGTNGRAPRRKQNTEFTSC